MTTDAEPMLSLAAGVLPEFSPDEIVRAAASAGFEASGIWFDPETWMPEVTKRVSTALDETGLIALDMEPIFVTPDGDHGDRLIDIAAELGARNILTVGRSVETEAFIERFGELCARAAPADMSVCVEFARIFAIADLPTALRVVAECGQQNAGVLVDNLHLARAGHSPADLRDAPTGVFPYAQLCDGPASLDDESREALYADAVTGRQNLGEGDLPVTQVFDALPDGTPISLEIRSAELARQFPDPVERARAVLLAAKRVLGAERGDG